MVTMALQDVLRDILGSYRVQFLFLPEGCGQQETAALDFHFREQLYEAFDYPAFAAAVTETVPEKGAVCFRDEFGSRYLVFRSPEEGEPGWYFCGPYVHRLPAEEDLEKLMERHRLSPGALEAVRWHFRRTPVVADPLSWNQMFSTLLSRYLANPDLQILPASAGEGPSERERIFSSVSEVPYTAIEARYAVEAKLLDAIRRGDISEALYQENMFMGFHLESRHADPVRNAKDMLLAVNTLFRKAVELAAVHPLYIDAINRRFTVEIEAMDSVEALNALVPTMIRNYCRLVQTYSRERYSSTVRDCLNYIDFHYMEPLSLEKLARKHAVNKNYLSARFHKEVQMTVTDYINISRVQHSLQLLSSTTLSMQEIAERCGFSEANYFTRTFKRIHGTTPNEYRKSLRRGEPGE